VSGQQQPCVPTTARGHGTTLTTMTRICSLASVARCPWTAWTTSSGK